MILKCILKMWGGSVVWIDLALDRDNCWAVMNVVMNLRFP
jgi:hypothetical protein